MLKKAFRGIWLNEQWVYRRCVSSDPDSGDKSLNDARYNYTGRLVSACKSLIRSGNNHAHVRLSTATSSVGGWSSDTVTVSPSSDTPLRSAAICCKSNSHTCHHSHLCTNQSGPQGPIL